MIGNKGGIQIYFSMNGLHYNFIGVHLIHGQDRRVERDEMMEELLKSLKVKRQEMDPDIVCDYNFIMGDLNYRFETTYDEMMQNDKILKACEMVDDYD